MSRYEKRKIQTKQKIVEAAYALFTEVGFEQATMEQIAEKADVAKGTLFNHFANKNALLAHFGEKRVKLIKEAIEQRISEADGAVNKLYAIFDAMADVHEEDRLYVSLFMHEFMYRYTFGERKNYNEAMAAIEEVIKNGIASGELRSDLNSVQTVSLLFAIYFHTTIDWIRDGDTYSPKESFRAQLEIVLRGICASDYSNDSVL
ncbi:TetR/AcrR family transcriptional regulator [Paenibacillus xylaniclasticus]|uniref:TetR/AcrR family transcriptional regulator n=1 Tax=Paenibacillus xylaniclasticus TaxID=588083 RepID=UPI001FE858D7|nr:MULTISPECIES: TetR/AcrR family transcriptional regulator [Paenibacillus]